MTTLVRRTPLFILIILGVPFVVLGLLAVTALPLSSQEPLFCDALREQHANTVMGRMTFGNWLASNWPSGQFEGCSGRPPPPTPPSSATRSRHVANGQAVTALEPKYTPMTNERSVSFLVQIPTHLIDDGGVVSYSFIASCKGESCQPRDVAFMVGVSVSPPLHVNRLDLIAGDLVVRSTSLTGSSVGFFEVPSVAILRLLAEARNDERGITARVGVFGGKAATFNLAGMTVRRLHELAEYLDPSVLGIPGSPVRLLGHKMRRIGDPAKDMGHSVKLTLYVLNDTDAPIHGWRGDLQITDPFGDDLVAVELTAGDSPLGPGDIRNAVFEWEDNPYSEDEVYDKLAAFEGNGLTVTLASVRTFSSYPRR